MTDDKAIQDTEKASAEESEAARLFDIRRIIGGLFTLYGLLLIGAGIFDGDAAKKQAAGIDINLWTGLGMLLLGLAMLLWMRLNPVTAPEPREDDGDRDRRPAH